MQKIRTVSCGEALELSRKVGTRVLWRPSGTVNYKQPASDEALVLED